jgi:hypothetical protein
LSKRQKDALCTRRGLPRRVYVEGGTGALTPAQPTVSGVAFETFRPALALRAGTWMMPGNLMATTSRSGTTDESVRHHLIACSYGPGCFKNPASG